MADQAIAGGEAISRTFSGVTISPSKQVVASGATADFTATPDSTHTVNGSSVAVKITFQGKSYTPVTIPSNAVTISKTFTAADGGKAPIAGDFSIVNPTGATITLKTGQTYAASGGASNIHFDVKAEPGYSVATSNINVNVAIPATTVNFDAKTFKGQVSSLTTTEKASLATNLRVTGADAKDDVKLQAALDAKHRA